MSYQNANSPDGPYGSQSIGNYSMNSQTGQYTPSQPQTNAPTAKPVNIANQLQSTVNALTRGYLRKTPQPGSYIPLGSAAPQAALQPFKPLDKYRSFGVPFQGIQYGQQQQSGGGDPYSAMFSQAPSGY